MTTPAKDRPLDPSSPAGKGRDQAEQPPKLPTDRLPTPAERPRVDDGAVDGQGLRPTVARAGAEKGFIMPVKDDHLVALLRAAGKPVTRENWIDLNYGREVPSPWTALEECELPEELQDWTKVEMED